MKKILILGAGRSAAALIDYLSKEGQKNDWQIQVVDAAPDVIHQYESKYENVKASALDVLDTSARENLMQRANLVISMLPARFHIHAAESCLKLKKHLLTASYVDDEVQQLAGQIKQAGLIFLYECGLDPGIDHMSAMQMIDHIRSQGGHVTSFQSFCGGLMAPGSDDNPWRYKFTWNPRNVVLAGKGGTAQYIYKGIYKNIPHHQLFKRLTMVEIPEFGEFESYPNRDSLNYRELYGLYKAETVLRGTLRRPGFCSAWHAFVQLGLTDDSYLVRNVENMTYAEFTRSYLPYSKDDLLTNFSRYIGVDISSEVMQRIKWLGILDEKPIGLKKATPAQVMQQLLENKWKADQDDEDMIVMQHQLEYQIEDELRKSTSSLVTIGQIATYSAMSKTVGYPLGIVAKLILQNKISERGLMIPVHKEVYQPVLKELELLNIKFIEEEEQLTSASIS
ncbi:saccharopine dehydrogenase-like NADP-dependent oxidoreductase [Catalinimonas alkaloidigena]|uniref:saccharopine dehydrogenase C-terminal domain-containing protein n=1 Tax=Catalinimonas alkaloidigena TaxID=1075417 RepID=UPI0024058FFC|nr:saccharopine dehydrogenase C-terminal domain-containing protein [Catalinimonas alkaloidigena]MDF9800404.1 saccharopine dehydrogenase-like NADP-dependent oxidoreductase [Catalinimonas alkaloidigena]